MSQDLCTNTFELYAKYALSGFFGKTSRERSQAKAGRLSDSSCPKWTSSGTVWRGGYLMRSSSEWPSDAAVSFLSDILEPAPPVEVLAEPESLRGDYPSSREKREALAAAARRGASSAGFKFHQGAGAGGIGFEAEQSPTCTADWHNPGVLTFAQNTRDEVRIQGDGTISGALSAQPGMKQTTYVCETGLMKTLGTNDSAAAVGPAICMADDNAKAAIDEEMCGSLKVGGAPPMAAYDEAVSQ